MLWRINTMDPPPPWLYATVSPTRLGALGLSGVECRVPRSWQPGQGSAATTMSITAPERWVAAHHHAVWRECPGGSETGFAVPIGITVETMTAAKPHRSIARIGRTSKGRASLGYQFSDKTSACCKTFCTAASCKSGGCYLAPSPNDGRCQGRTRRDGRGAPCVRPCACPASNR
jgi:hypothetical protein